MSPKPRGRVPPSRRSLRLASARNRGQSSPPRSDASPPRSARRQGHERAGHRRRRADDVRQAEWVVGQLASGGPPRFRVDDVAGAHRRRPRADRRRHRRLRDAGGRAEHEPRPQRLGVGRAPAVGAGHHRGPPVRLVPTGRPLRRGRRGRRPLRPGHRVRRRGDEPRPAGLERPWRHGALPAFVPRARRRPPLDPVPGQPGAGRPLRDHAGGDGRLRARVPPPRRRQLGLRATSSARPSRCRSRPRTAA